MFCGWQVLLGKDPMTETSGRIVFFTATLKMEWRGNELYVGRFFVGDIGKHGAEWTSVVTNEEATEHPDRASAMAALEEAVRKALEEWT